jgi:hypothetical protein
VEARAAGFNSTWCCQLDDSKVVSGDGCAVRLWAAESGRRIATLRGHGGRVTAVAFDDDVILSGCSQGTVKAWSMDELKLTKTLRHHTGPVAAALLLHGLPISAGKDGSVCLWDVAAPNSPLVVLEAGGAVHALGLLEERGALAQLAVRAGGPAAASGCCAMAATQPCRAAAAGSVLRRPQRARASAPRTWRVSRPVPAGATRACLCATTPPPPPAPPNPTHPHPPVVPASHRNAPSACLPACLPACPPPLRGACRLPRDWQRRAGRVGH